MIIVSYLCSRPNRLSADRLFMAVSIVLEMFEEQKFSFTGGMIQHVFTLVIDYGVCLIIVMGFCALRYTTM